MKIRNGCAWMPFPCNSSLDMSGLFVDFGSSFVEWEEVMPKLCSSFWDGWLAWNQQETWNLQVSPKFYCSTMPEVSQIWVGYVRTGSNRLAWRTAKTSKPGVQPSSGIGKRCDDFASAGRFQPEHWNDHIFIYRTFFACLNTCRLLPSTMPAFWLHGRMDDFAAGFWSLFLFLFGHTPKLRRRILQQGSDYLWPRG